jgi:hypothetical protein
MQVSTATVSVRVYVLLIIYDINFVYVNIFNFNKIIIFLIFIKYLINKFIVI